jgi:hydroxyacylglutathione hydrolase
MTRLDIEMLPALSDNYVYLLHEPAAGVTAVIDPAEAAPIEARLAALGRTLDLILITHHHNDHIGGVGALKAAFGCQVVGPEKDRARIPGLDRGVAEGDRVEVGGAVAKVLETPGHTSGHVSYWFAGQRALFCADTLFALGCGRLFEGTPAQMWASLSKFAPLPDDALIYCGHEYTQSNARFARSVDPDNAALQARAAEIDRLRAAGQPTIPARLGEERATNPFLRPADPAIRRQLGLAEASDVEVFAELRRRKDSF